MSLELIDTYPYTIESEIALRLASSKTTGIFLGHTEETTTACFSSDDKYIASGSWDGTIIIGDAKSGAKLQKLTPFHNNYLLHILAAYLASLTFDAHCSAKRAWFAAEDISPFSVAFFAASSSVFCFHW